MKTIRGLFNFPSHGKLIKYDDRVKRRLQSNKAIRGICWGYDTARINKEYTVKHQENDWNKIIFCVLLLLVAGMAVLIRQTAGKQEEQKQTAVAEKLEVTPTPSGESQQKTDPAASPTDKAPAATEDPAAGVYTYLQGPKSWKSRLDWSGQWGKAMYDGGSFGGFGCGLCCLANIYSTETEGECSPLDMYTYAKKHTEYGGGGAIAWEYMQRVLERTGFTAKLCHKPSTYEKFQKEVAASRCNIVLVSSADSDCYWENTPGHYVTIFLYDQQKDQIFLADSGDPEHNRHWVKLKKIYKSLKTNSDYQYLRVTGYDQAKDTWKHKGTTGTWMKPDNI